jgi:DNA-binding MarR family transcriptional regulator
MDSEVALLIHHLGRAHHLIQGLLQKEIDRSEIDGDLNPGMRPIFCLLTLEVGLTVSEIAGKLGQAKSSVTGAVRRMESAGLVTLDLDGNDGRRRRVKLTEKGRNLVPVCERIEQTIEDRLAEKLQKEEMRELLRILIKMTDLVDQS